MPLVVLAFSKTTYGQTAVDAVDAIGRAISVLLNARTNRPFGDYVGEAGEHFNGIPDLQTCGLFKPGRHGAVSAVTTEALDGEWVLAGLKASD